VLVLNGDDDDALALGGGPALAWVACKVAVRKSDCSTRDHVFGHPWWVVILNEPISKGLHAKNG
jgi:hypothetical protein